MFTILMAGILAALAILILLCKLGLKRFIRHDIILDFAISMLLGVLFVGTMSGMMIALIGGITASIALYVIKQFIPKEEYEPIISPELKEKANAYKTKAKEFLNKGPFNRKSDEVTA